MSPSDYEKKDRFKVWYKQGKFDLGAAKVSLDADYPEWAAFQAVQAVEKGLKSVIVYAGINPPKIHKLQTLIGMANRVCPEFRDTRFEFRYLESFTFISRYPFLLPGKEETPHEIIKKEDSQKALEQAVDIMEKIGNILSHEVTEVGSVLEMDEYSEKEIDERLEEIKTKLVEEFSPEKIILFGRFARQKQVPRLSTMDILVIADTELRFIERINKAREVTKGDDPIIEPIVYTPSEFKIMTEDVGEGFLESALEEGRVVYERKRDTI